MLIFLIPDRYVCRIFLPERTRISLHLNRSYGLKRSLLGMSPVLNRVQRSPKLNFSQLLLDLHLERRTGRARHTPLQIIRTRNEWQSCLTNRLSSAIPTSLSVQLKTRPSSAASPQWLGHNAQSTNMIGRTQWASVWRRKGNGAASAALYRGRSELKFDLVVFLSLTRRWWIKLK